MTKDKDKSKDIPKAVVKKAVKKVVAAKKAAKPKKVKEKNPKYGLMQTKVKPTPRFYKQWGKGKRQWVFRRDGFHSLSIEHVTGGEVNEIHVLEKEIPELIQALIIVQKKVAVAKALAKERGKPFV